MARIVRLERRLSLNERLECLPGPMEPHLDGVRRSRERSRGLLGIKFFDIAQQKDAPVFVG